MKTPHRILAVTLGSLLALTAGIRAQTSNTPEISAQTVKQAFNQYKNKYGRGNLFIHESVTPTAMDNRFKSGFGGTSGISGTACAFLADYSIGYRNAGNWVRAKVDGATTNSVTIAIAPKAMFANAAKWEKTTDGKSTLPRTGRQFLQVLDKGKKWKVNWALGAGEYIKSYPMMAYDLAKPARISDNLTARSLTATWNFAFGYPKVNGKTDSSKMDYNVMHELYFDGTATGTQGSFPVRLQVELAQSKNHSMSPIRTVTIKNQVWDVGFFHNSAAKQYIWQFTRRKTDYYRNIGGARYPAYACNTVVDIFPLLQWLKQNPNIAKEKPNGAGNPTFPSTLLFKRVETGIEIVRGLDGSCFLSKFYKMVEK